MRFVLVAVLLSTPSVFVAYQLAPPAISIRAAQRTDTAVAVADSFHRSEKRRRRRPGGAGGRGGSGA